MSFEGEMNEIDLVQRLVDLGREKFTGAIRFENDGIIKIVYFKGGDILSASTNDRGDSIDEILFRAGKVTREHIKQALAKRKESETLGDALLGLGFITRKELTWARRVQVIGIIRSILTWQAGSWTIVADYLPKREEGTIFPLAQIILELIVTDPDRAKFERAMESGSAVFHRVEGFDDAFRRLGLNEDAEAITAHLDGVKSASDVASASGKDTFNVYKLLEALRVLGLLKLVGGADEHPSLGAAPAVVPTMSHGEVDNPDFSLHDEEPPAYPGVALEPEPSEMPSWDSASRPAAMAAVPMARSVWDEPDDHPTAALPPTISAEPEWGFDEAQIEAARRAALPRAERNRIAPRERTASKPSRSMVPIITLVGLLVLLAGGWAGWTWWQGRQDAATTASVPQPKSPRPRVGLPNASQSSTASDSAAPGLASTSTTASAPAPSPSGVSSKAGTASIPMAASAATAGSMKSSAAPGSPVSPKHPLPVNSASTATVTSTHMGTAGLPSSATAPQVVASKPVPPATANRSVAKPPVPKKVTPSENTPVERTSTGIATITNSGSAPAPAAGDPALTQKYEAMARDFAADRTGAFTIQIELVCENASVSRALQSGGGKLWFAPITFHGRGCYRVFWGRFDTHEAALAATSSIPAGLKGSAPVVVRIPR
jgi:hypothetical protein